MNLYEAIKICPLFMALAFATGCAQRTDYVFAMPPETSAEDFLAATRAAEEWQACNVVTASVRIGTPEGEDVPLRRVATIADHQGFVAWWSASGSIVYLDAQGHDLQSTLAHEMGHELGMLHTQKGLMKPHNAQGAVGSEECRALALERR